MAAGRRVAALREHRHWTKTELAEKAGLTRVYVGEFEAGRAARPMGKTLAQLARALGWPSFAALMGSEALDPPGLDGGRDGVSPRGAAAVSYADDDEAEDGGEGGGTPTYTVEQARVYPGYGLWRRNDPRDPEAERVALSPGRRVMCEAGDRYLPKQVFVVKVEDAGALELHTAQGRVGNGWRIFVDRASAEDAGPGVVVAAMNRRGELVVGELRRDGAGAWSVATGGTLEPIERGDVLGTALKYQAPPSWFGRVAAPGATPPVTGSATGTVGDGRVAEI